MDETLAKSILGTILDAVNGWVGRSVPVKDLAVKIGVSQETTQEYLDELYGPRLVAFTMPPTVEKKVENLRVYVTHKGRYFFNNLPDPLELLGDWADVQSPKFGKD